MLVDGKWMENWQPVQKADNDGRFVRQTSSFRNWIMPDGAAGPTGEGGFTAESGRYRLYVALICPWASRTLIARKLKGLDDVIPVTVVNPTLTDQGWSFGGYPGADEDPMFGSRYMHELYTLADPNFTGRATVPVLWDMEQNVMVNNESADILRMFDTAFEHVVPSELRLYPEDLAAEIDALNPRVFAMLDELEERLTGDYLFGESVTETDIRAFVTLIRFDAAYHGLFKTNRRQVKDYPRLTDYVTRMLDLPGVRETVNMDHILHGYYSIKALNPNGIVPKAPDHIAELLSL